MGWLGGSGSGSPRTWQGRCWLPSLMVGTGASTSKMVHTPDSLGEALARHASLSRGQPVTCPPNTATGFPRASDLREREREAEIPLHFVL